MSETAPRFRAVVFDLDGTLIDSYDAIHDALSTVLRSFGQAPVSRDQVRRMVGHGLESLIERHVGAENVEEGVELFRERYREVGLEMTALLPGAEHVVRELAKRDVAMAVASNKPSDFSRDLLYGLGIGGRFDEIVGPDLGFPPKPDPAMVLEVLESMAVEASDALFVGDMPIDVETARAAGMPVAALPTGSSSRRDLEAAKPDFLLERLVEVLDLFPGGRP